MNASLTVLYPHTLKGLISREDVTERADASDADAAIELVRKVAKDIRKNGAWGCFHVNENGAYNLCVSFESDGSVELLFQHHPNSSIIKALGTPRSQMQKVRRIIIEHFEGTQSFDKQLEDIYGTN